LKVCLALLPSFSSRLVLPHLGHACLRAACRERGREVEAVDFRAEFAGEGLTLPLPLFTVERQFACDIMEIELLWDLVTASDRGASSAELLALPAGATRRRYAAARRLSPDRLDASLQALADAARRAVARLDGYDVVGFTMYGSNLYLTWLTALLLKRRRRPPRIILGGPQVTQSRVTRELALATGMADVCVTGPADDVLPCLLDGLQAGTAVDPVVESGDRRPDLDRLPPPLFDGAYEAPYRPFSLPVHGSRGCPGTCRFCQERVLHRGFAQRAATLVTHDIALLSAATGARLFHFADSLLNGSRPWLERLAGNLAGQGVYWSGYLRAGVDSHLAGRLAAAGLVSVVMGIESLSEGVLERMNKRATPDVNLESITALISAGIDVTVNLIVGFPGETQPEFATTFKLCRELAERLGGRGLGFGVQPFELRVGSMLSQSPESAGIKVGYFSPPDDHCRPELEDIARRVPLTFEVEGLDPKVLALRRHQLLQLPRPRRNVALLRQVIEGALRPDSRVRLAPGFTPPPSPDGFGDKPTDLHLPGGSTVPDDETTRALLRSLREQGEAATVGGILAGAVQPPEARRRLAALIEGKAVWLSWGGRG